MQLRFSPEDEALREQVRAFVREHLPTDIRRKVARGLRLERDDYERWFRILEQQGWITPAWPPEHGGTGWTTVQRFIFDEETQLGGAPRIIAAGIQMLGPVLIRFGTAEQKSRYLPDIRHSRTWWAQGFSEPGAGSDLASLRTTAVLEPDGRHFVVNGHKVWTSYAQWCSMMFALVRTDPKAKPQEGISFLLIDMASPGVQVRPIRTMDGGTDLNEVFLDQVRVPAENLVGALHQGWTCAKFLLGHERTGIAGIASCKQQLVRARHLARLRGMAGDAVVASRLAQLEAEVMALEFTALRLLGHGQSCRLRTTQASMLKVSGTELRQSIFDLLIDLAGLGILDVDSQVHHADGENALDRLDGADTVMANALDARKLSLYGGTNEVQRTLIGREALSV